MDSIFDWPGKSDHERNERPAVLHMLDVAACAEKLIEKHTSFSRFSASQRRAFVILVALHDVGKLSESFKALVRQNRGGNPLHWELSDFLLCGTLDEILCRLGNDKWVRDELYAAVAGHHGQPPRRVGGSRRQKSRCGSAIGEGVQAARKWVRTLLALFPDASLAGLSLKDAKSLSWVLSGLTVAADWVGSNPVWFPIEQGQRDFESALKKSRYRADLAVTQAGLVPPDLVQPNSVIPLGLSRLRPMQKAALNVRLPSGPQMAVIEDSTGTGKTEAALILAHRMISLRKARGIFFALPTMATSNAMFERLDQIADKLFDSHPSVVLTHSRSRLSDAFRGVSGTECDETPEATGSSWLTDSRRRSLLATVGVGTVDQALLGILPTRFSTLRLFGLADKVLIVDEAHSYDPYMQRELETLLSMQARLGGSVILMTASLPLAMRQSYVTAFQHGLDASECVVDESRYPGVHLVSREVDSIVVKSTPDQKRSIEVKRLNSTVEAIELLKNAVFSGWTCVWVRNAVDDAIAAVKLLQEQGIEADLLHARFSMIDRLDLEQSILEKFGKTRKGHQGQVLVATQVVEASLDLDFDVMVTDLAPIGSLIQRAGRLWRHMEKRPESVRPASGLILNILSPDPLQVDNDRWLHGVLDGGAWVYRLDDQWRTAKVLFETGEITVPEGLRPLMEAVHGVTKLVLPEVLEEAGGETEGQAMAEAGYARVNIVEAKNGYLNGTKGAVGNDALFPTRIGIPQVTIVLARFKDSRLVPWAKNKDKNIAWALSEVSASKRRFDQLLPDQEVVEIQSVKREWPDWRCEAHKLCVVGEGGVLNENLLYDKKFGLRIAPRLDGNEPVCRYSMPRY